MHTLWIYTLVEWIKLVKWIQWITVWCFLLDIFGVNNSCAQRGDAGLRPASYVLNSVPWLT